MAGAKSICITGTDRGIGLELVRRYLEMGYEVFAGGLSPENAGLQELAARYSEQLHAIRLDVGNDDSVRETASYIRERTDTLDMLINNAALLGDTQKSIEDAIDFDQVQKVYNVTAVGTIRMANALIREVMNGGKLIVNISSEAGSIGNSYREAWFGYCMAKAALNMGSTIIHTRIRQEGGRVLLLHPGWVKTYLSGVWDDAGKYTPSESAEHIVRTIEARGREVGEHPLYLEADTGKPLPW